MTLDDREASLKRNSWPAITTSHTHHDHNLVIRNGVIVDGTGGEPFEADVAVKDGKIARVGNVSGRGSEEIDAKGKLVTPGFVDIHTHYDGQAVWDAHLAPSAWHGVTSVVMGNCGVGFAPCRPADREKLVELMEGVEDNPGRSCTRGSPGSGKVSQSILRH